MADRGIAAVRTCGASGKPTHAEWRAICAGTSSASSPEAITRPWRKSRITTLIRPFRYKDWRGVEEGPERAYEADAEVLRGIKGVSTGEIVRLVIPGSSCDFPFAVGVRGYIAEATRLRPATEKR